MATSPRSRRVYASARRFHTAKTHFGHHKVPPPHSITSSARASNVAGMSSPSAFAVLRLITSSNFVGCSTARSIMATPSAKLLTCQPQLISRPNRQVCDRFTVVQRRKGSLFFCSAKRRDWHVPEEAVSLGEVRLLGMTGRVENVPLPPNLTRSRPRTHLANGWHLDTTSRPDYARSKRKREAGHANSTSVCAQHHNLLGRDGCFRRTKRGCRYGEDEMG